MARAETMQQTILVADDVIAGSSAAAEASETGFGAVLPATDLGSAGRWTRPRAAIPSDRKTGGDGQEIAYASRVAAARSLAGGERQADPVAATRRGPGCAEPMDICFPSHRFSGYVSHLRRHSGDRTW